MAWISFVGLGPRVFQLDVQFSQGKQKKNMPNVINDVSSKNINFNVKIIIYFFLFFSVLMLYFKNYNNFEWKEEMYTDYVLVIFVQISLN